MTKLYIIVFAALACISTVAIAEEASPKGIPVHITANDGVPVRVVGNGIPVTPSEQCSSNNSLTVSLLKTQLDTYAVQMQILIELRKISGGIKSQATQ
jgi:hypothetical protein